MKEAIFTGAATAIVTPFAEGKPDLQAYEKLLQMQAEAGISAIVVCGTTGEASTLSISEREQLFRFTDTYLKGTCKWIAGIGTNSTKTSIELAVQAKDLGAYGLLAVTPYYNKCTQKGLLEHYTAIADSTALPLILYNVPSRTGVDILPETCKVLSEHPHINGIKEASGAINRIGRIRSLCGNSFHIWSGNDDQIVPTMSLGGKGVISVLSNLFPKAVRAMCDACLQGNYDTASEMQIHAMPLIDALFSEVNPIPIKAALAARKLCKNELRLPLTIMTKEKQALLLSAMESFESSVKADDLPL